MNNLDALQEAGNEVAHAAEARRKLLDRVTEMSEVVRSATARRNVLIVAAREDRWPWAEIADVTGLTVSGVEKIAERTAGHRPSPQE